MWRRQVKYKEATKYRSAGALPNASEGDRAYRQMVSDASKPSNCATSPFSSPYASLRPLTTDPSSWVLRRFTQPRAGVRGINVCRRDCTVLQYDSTNTPARVLQSN